MTVRTPRMGTWKPCLIDTCHALVLTCGNRKRCDDCRRALWRDKVTAQRGRPKRHYTRTVEPYQESPATIERNFQAALKVVRRIERETLIGWASPLARIFGS